MKRILNTFVAICLVYLVYMIAYENTYETSKSIEMLIENNQFTEFSFQSGEKAICVYEGQASFELPKEKFAIYKETKEKNIIFMNMLFIEKDTGNIYTWGEEDLICIGKFAEEFEVINNTAQNLRLENATEDEVLDGVAEVLKQNGYTEFRLMYDGTRNFANRNYYVASTFDDFEDHIIRTQKFFVDMENGNVYQSDENNDFLRTELYYLGSMQYGVIDQNPYFFNKDHLHLKAYAKYDDMIHAQFVEEVVCAEMYLVKEYGQGSVYKFVVEPLGMLTDARQKTYFYVTSDKICRLWSYVYQDAGVDIVQKEIPYI